MYTYNALNIIESQWITLNLKTIHHHSPALFLRLLIGFALTHRFVRVSAAWKGRRVTEFNGTTTTSLRPTFCEEELKAPDRVSDLQSDQVTVGSKKSPALCHPPRLHRLLPISSPPIQGEERFHQPTQVLLQLSVRHLSQWKWRQSQSNVRSNKTYPKYSMYRIFTYLWVILWVNVSEYAIHGVSGTANGQ